VLLRNKSPVGQTLDSHGFQPRATLVDNQLGGVVASFGGDGTDGTPSHVDRFTVWNMLHAGGRDWGEHFYDVWNTNPETKLRDWLFKPVFVGMHGDLGIGGDARDFLVCLRPIRA
jgi:hypothetical protein